MFYPTLTPPGVTRTCQSVFGTLSTRPVPPEGALAAMKNLAATAYPALTTRPHRGAVATLDGAAVAACQALCYKDCLLWLDAAGTLHGGGYSLASFADPADGRPRQLVTMGAYLCVFPDRRWCNAALLCQGALTDADHGDLESTFETKDSIELTMCTADAASYEGVTISAACPQDPENGAYWLDKSRRPRLLYRWSAADLAWEQVETTYLRIKVPGIDEAFAVGDAVTLDQFTLVDNDATAAEQLRALQAAQHTVCAKGENYIVIDGVLDAQCTIPVYRTRLAHDITRCSADYPLQLLLTKSEADLEAIAATLPGRTVYPATVSRTVPDLDFVVECGNRLWGCRYDPEAAAGPVNELYACALGDFKNWHRFEGLASDAYRASRGADGPFTGAAVYGGCVLFFRERSLEKIYPAASGAHQIVTTTLDGVAPGCHGSLQTVGGLLYYLSAAGVMAYDGSLPVCVSGELASSAAVQAATAGALHDRYYLSVRTASGDHLLVYDTARALWRREDATYFTACATGPQDLFFATDDGLLHTVLGTQGAREGAFAWSLQTPPLGQTCPDHQYTARLELRLRLAAGATCSVQAQYDADGTWRSCGSITAASDALFTFPIRPHRCAQCQLRLTGTGDVTLYSITRSTTEGSERG